MVPNSNPPISMRVSAPGNGVSVPTMAQSTKMLGPSSGWSASQAAIAPWYA